MSAADLRAAAKRSADARQASRILAIAMVLDGFSREDAARLCGMDRQTLRDWVHRYNKAGLDGLADLPTVNIEAMNKHLIEMGKCIGAGAIALLVVDGAGWHSSPKLVVPDNIVLLKLPPYAPELNPAENIWEYLRGNTLSQQVWETYDAIVDACCDAWNGLMQKPEIIRSIATRKWAQVMN